MKASCTFLFARFGATAFPVNIVQAVESHCATFHRERQKQNLLSHQRLSCTSQTSTNGYLDVNRGDLRGLAALLGHANLNTVMIYTEPRLEDLAERMEQVELAG